MWKNADSTISNWMRGEVGNNAREHHILPPTTRSHFVSMLALRTRFFTAPRKAENADPQSCVARVAAAP